MQNYNFVKNDVFVAKICKYALYESSEGLFCAPRKAANFCHPEQCHSFINRALGAVHIFRQPNLGVFQTALSPNSISYLRKLTA